MENNDTVVNSLSPPTFKQTPPSNKHCSLGKKTLISAGCKESQFYSLTFGQSVPNLC